MEDLRESLVHLNFHNLQTYIQSGNIVFGAEEKDTASLAEQIHEVIQKDFGFDVPVIVLSKDELQKVAGSNPFINKRDEDINRLYITFLAKKPEQEFIKKLSSKDLGTEEFVVDDRAVYIFCPTGYGRAKLNNNFIENKLKVTATTRNWKTVKKLLDMTC